MPLQYVPLSSLTSRISNFYKLVLTDRKWLLKEPCCPIKTMQQPSGSSFHVIHDDLMHGYFGGNKARKLDAIVPKLLEDRVTDVVTCGGLQSAHTSAVPAAFASAAAACGQRVRVHLLVRGERPAIPTGHHLVALMHAASVTYVSRSKYADRRLMLDSKAAEVLAEHPGSKVSIIEEGAQGSLAMLGMLRLVHWLATSAEGLPDPTSTEYHLVIDSGTGTSAAGAALAVQLLGLPWKVMGVMLAGDENIQIGHRLRLGMGDPGAILHTAICKCRYYQDQGLHLSSQFRIEIPQTACFDRGVEPLPLTWVPRIRPRKFGKLVEGDIAACKEVAQLYGVSLDPIWTLAAWEVSAHLSDRYLRVQEGFGCEAVLLPGLPLPVSSKMTPTAADMPKRVAMLHTGGSGLSLQGLAQRYPNLF